MKSLLIIIAMSFLILGVQAQARLIVGCSTQDIEALVQAVGGKVLDTFSIAKGTQDPHQIDAKPSFIVKFRKANLVVSQGLELEAAWLDPLIRDSRNPDIAAGSKGSLELGPMLDPIEVMRGNVSRGEGDVHPLGNPHFQLDPIRLGRAAKMIAQRLAELDPTNQQVFISNADTFQKNLEDKYKQWKKRLEKVGIKEFVSYHKSFSYFADRFGIKNVLYLEPKPGIPPTTSHTIEVIKQMKERNINLILIENFFDDSIRGKIESAIPTVKVFKVPVYVGGEPGITKNEDLIEKIVLTFEKAVQK